MDTFHVYKDIRARTNGEIYIGVVGPVRTGKSTFIKRFMDLMVLPNMEDEYERNRARDELPQSSAGKTIMTTEPKFVPNEAIEITVGDDIVLKVRLIDCVGYMVEGAVGHLEENEERLVKTPWFEYEIPFTKTFYEYKQLEKDTPSHKEELAKYGYSAKELHHLLRLEEFIYRYTHSTSYEECLQTKAADYLIAVKLGYFNLNFAREAARSSIERIMKMTNDFCQKDIEPHKEVEDLLNDVQYNIMKKAITKELKGY